MRCLVASPRLAASRAFSARSLKGSFRSEVNGGQDEARGPGVRLGERAGVWLGLVQSTGISSLTSSTFDSVSKVAVASKASGGPSISRVWIKLFRILELHSSFTREALSTAGASFVARTSSLRSAQSWTKVGKRGAAATAAAAAAAPAAQAEPGRLRFRGTRVFGRPEKCLKLALRPEQAPVCLVLARSMAARWAAWSAAAARAASTASVLHATSAWKAMRVRCKAASSCSQSRL